MIILILCGFSLYQCFSIVAATAIAIIMIISSNWCSAVLLMILIIFIMKLSRFCLASSWLFMEIHWACYKILYDRRQEIRNEHHYWWARTRMLDRLLLTLICILVDINDGICDSMLIQISFLVICGLSWGRCIEVATCILTIFTYQRKSIEEILCYRKFFGKNCLSFYCRKW